MESPSLAWGRSGASSTRHPGWTGLPATVGVQGNLDPFLLSTTPAAVAAEANRILREMAGRPGHIFNLGHGVPPTAKLENIQTLVDTVRNYGHS